MSTEHEFLPKAEAQPTGERPKEAFTMPEVPAEQKSLAENIRYQLDSGKPPVQTMQWILQNGTDVAKFGTVSHTLAETKSVAVNNTLPLSSPVLSENIPFPPTPAKEAPQAPPAEASITQDPRYQKIVEELSLKFLKSKDTAFFNSNFSGVAPSGYLLDRNGNETPFLPSQNIGVHWPQIEAQAKREFSALYGGAQPQAGREAVPAKDSLTLAEPAAGQRMSAEGEPPHIPPEKALNAAQEAGVVGSAEVQVAPTRPQQQEGEEVFDNESPAFMREKENNEVQPREQAEGQQNGKSPQGNKEHNEQGKEQLPHELKDLLDRAKNMQKLVESADKFLLHHITLLSYYLASPGSEAQQHALELANKYQIPLNENADPKNMLSAIVSSLQEKQNMDFMQNIPNVIEGAQEMRSELDKQFAAAGMVALENETYKNLMRREVTTMLKHDALRKLADEAKKQTQLPWWMVFAALASALMGGLRESVVSEVKKSLKQESAT